MKIINNTTEKLADDLRVTIKKRSRVSMAAACFSVYAFEELKAQLENLDELRVALQKNKKQIENRTEK